MCDARSYSTCNGTRRSAYLAHARWIAWRTTIEHRLSHGNQGAKRSSGHFQRFALPIIWDFAEANPFGDRQEVTLSALRLGCAGRLAHLSERRTANSTGQLLICSATAATIDESKFDVVVTDPPYYDAIPYSDLMDFFYVWLRRTFHGLSPEIDEAFREPLGPKWNAEKKDGELIDDSSRFGGDKAASKDAYEDGMFRAFQACDRALVPDGRMVVVFANKSPDAWETLVSAIIRAGFVVDGSWPIQTEMGNRTSRALRRPRSPLPFGSYAASGPRPLAPDGTIASSTRCARTSTPSFANTGMPASAAPTSYGRRPARRWKPTASIRSSRRPTSQARRWRSRSSCAPSAGS